MANRSDTFNRANASTLGTPSDGGSAWDQYTWTWGIDTNRAKCDGGLHTLATLESSASDVLVEVTFPGVWTNGRIAFRATNASNYLMAVVNRAASTIGTYKWEGGSLSEIVAPVSVTMADGDRYGVRAVGTSIKVYRNGSEITALAGTSAFNQTATKHGIGCFLSPDFFEDFSITDLGAPPASAKVPIYHLFGGLQ